jgi:uncharacterized pyridoxal phosphate-dependent enzyme
MGIYEELGVRRVINAAAALTKLGGSLMPNVVLDAMRDAADSFVDISELHDRVGERIAQLTRNEAACVSCGAAAGILMSVAACLVGTDPELLTALPGTEGVARDEVVYFRGQKNGFLSAVREAGARLVEIGGNEAELVAAINARTAAVLWFAGAPFIEDSLPLDPIVRIAKARGVPVIVDAADQAPPVSRLWRYTIEQGADLAIFSGGKGLRGPQSSGLIVGRADLIAGCRANAGPLHSIARPAKVGKEEMIGLLSAVERAISISEADQFEGWQRVVDGWAAAFSNIPGIFVEKRHESHSGQRVPRLILKIADGSDKRDAVIAALWERSPRIAVLPEGDSAIGLNPQAVDVGQSELIASAMREEIAGL